MLTFIKTDNSVTVFLQNKCKTVLNDDPVYEEVVEGIKSNISENEMSEILDKLSVIKEYVEDYNELQLTDNSILYNGKSIDNYVVDKIFKFKEEGYPIEPLINFLKNLMQNPAYRAVQELYKFLEYGKLPITQDGHFLAYKKVKNDYTDIYTGKFDNSIGSTIEMNRNEVDDNCNNTCSKGLHFCSYDYLLSYGSSTNNRVIVVKINPKDVVSIPVDYNNTKGRCCKYEVVDEYIGYKLEDAKPEWDDDFKEIWDDDEIWDEYIEHTVVWGNENFNPFEKYDVKAKYTNKGLIYEVTEYNEAEEIKEFLEDKDSCFSHKVSRNLNNGNWIVEPEL